MAAQHICPGMLAHPRDGTEQGIQTRAAVKFADILVDQLRVNGTIVIPFDTDSEVWQTPTMRNLIRRWQLKKVDVKGDVKRERWHARAP